MKTPTRKNKPIQVDMRKNYSFERIPTGKLLTP